MAEATVNGGAEGANVGGGLGADGVRQGEAAAPVDPPAALLGGRGAASRTGGGEQHREEAMEASNKGRRDGEEPGEAAVELGNGGAAEEGSG